MIDVDTINKKNATDTQYEISTAENDPDIVKEKLAASYQILSVLGLDDVTYTHLSAKVPGEEAFYIMQFGLLFEQVTKSNLIKVSYDGNVLEGEEKCCNQTGYITHSSIYKNRKDINAIFHLHTINTVAVSAMSVGLLPLSQWALHFYNRISYHDYDSLLLNNSRGDPLADSLGSSNMVMFLRNHGIITCGKTIHEALFYINHIEKACGAQCKIMSSKSKMIIPDSVACNKAVNDLLNFEKDLGKRDWTAMTRMLEERNISYKE